MGDIRAIVSSQVPNGSVGSNLFTLLGRTIQVWFGMLPLLIAGAVASVLVTALLTYLTDPDLFEGNVPVSVVVPHALYLVFMCRMTARRMGFADNFRIFSVRTLIAVLVTGFLIGVISTTVGALLPIPQAFSAVVVLSALFATTPILPALVIGSIRFSTAFWLRFIATACTAALPWLLVIEALGLPAQVCTDEGWGLFEGGIIMWPLLGLHMFMATTAAVVIPTVVYFAMTSCGGANND